MNIHSQIDKQAVSTSLPSNVPSSLHQGSPQASMPLMLATQGEKVTVNAIKADKSQARRLADLGLRVGKKLNIIHKNRAGVVVGIQGLRLAIGPSQAKTILVSPSA